MSKIRRLTRPLTGARLERINTDLEVAMASGADLGARGDHIRQIGTSLAELASVLHQASQGTGADDPLPPALLAHMSRLSALVQDLGSLAQQFPSSGDI